MTDLKLIEETEEYSVFISHYNGTTQTFRMWKDKRIEVRFNDEFAVANGFKSVSNLIEEQPQIKYQINMYCGGVVPEWISIVDGEFLIKTKQLLN